MYAAAKAALHTKWFNKATGWYDDGGQTAQVLALALDRRPPLMMSPAQRAGVLGRLVANIHAHGNHSTSGIIGFRYVMDVLSDSGHGALALALMTQTSYPSFGYQILNKYEPATTVWELWQSDVTGPRMNSRNHIMFGGPGSWLHTYVGGITNAPGSVGYEHVWFAPPAALIAPAAGARLPAPRVPRPTPVHGASGGAAAAAAAARRGEMATSASDPLSWAGASKETGRGTFALFWSWPQAAPANQSCTSGDEGVAVTVNCTGAGIGNVTFADYGTPSGDCATDLRPGNCTTPDLAALVAGVCSGQDSCTLACTARVAPGQFMGCTISAVSSAGGVRRKQVPLPDPCNGRRKAVGLQVRCRTGSLAVRTTTPPNSVATTAVPLLGDDPRTATVTEGGTVLWAGGTFVPGVAGVQGAVVRDGALLISHGSGVYDFRRLGY